MKNGQLPSDLIKRRTQINDAKAEYCLDKG